MTSYFSDPRTIKAPWTMEQADAIRRYQMDDRFHPYTCCDHQTMAVNRSGLQCPKCGIIQDWISDSTLKLMGVYE